MRSLSREDASKSEWKMVLSLRQTAKEAENTLPKQEHDQ